MIGKVILRNAKERDVVPPRTASIRKSDTLVLEDLKALSWKTCQEGSLLNLSDHRCSIRTVCMNDHGTYILPSFEEYTPPVTYPEEVEETLGTPIEIEPLDETKLEDLGLNTYNHDLPLSPREVHSIYELEPQPQPLNNCPSLDVSLVEERGPEPPSNHIVWIVLGRS
ncbi:hypothetical protein Tco_0658671 [Tanacetum coccineum]